MKLSNSSITVSGKENASVRLASALRTLCICAVSLLTGTEYVEAAIISFNASAEVTHPVIVLEDIATIRDNNAEVAQRLKNVTLAPAPAPGRQVRLDFALVRARLAAQGFNLTELELTGSSVVIVNSPEERIQKNVRLAPQRRTARAPISQSLKERTQNDIADAVKTALARYVPQLGEPEVSAELSLEQVPFFAQAATRQFEIAGGTAPFIGQQVFEVRFLDRAGQIQRAAVRCQVDLIPAVLVVKRHVARGQKLTAEDLGWERISTQTLSDEPIRDVQLVIGMEATRTLRDGDFVTTKTVRSPVLVQSGHIVTVCSRRGNIQIKTEAKARSSGGLNETVELVTLDGREKLQARVTGFREAEVLSNDLAPASPQTGVRYRVDQPVNTMDRQNAAIQNVGIQSQISAPPHDFAPQQTRASSLQFQN